MDSAYLLPVLSCNEGGEFEINPENDKPLLDTALHSYETTNIHELNLTRDNVQDNVYMEITRNNTEHPLNIN